jgi:hypothetical protein
MKTETLAKYFAAKVQQINKFHDLAIDAARVSLSHAIQAGRLLCEVKSKLAHGEWESWVATNLSLSEATARRYMRLARHEVELRDARRESPALTIDDALKVLAEPKAVTVEDEIIDLAALENQGGGNEKYGRFYDTCAALLRIRAAGLWRGTHASWDAYCLAKIGDPASRVDGILDMMLSTAKNIAAAA